MAWLPEKYRVTGADGKIDLEASGKKLGEGYAAAAARLGTGEVPPPPPPPRAARAGLPVA
jgi:hypothetical protein